MLQSQGEIVRQVLVQWDDRGEDTTTWEDITTLKEQFPNFNFEDKVLLGEGCNVRNKVWKV